MTESEHEDMIALELAPVGYELAQNIGTTIPALGGLACLNRLNSDYDDTMTGGHKDDPYVGDDPTLFSDSNEIYSLY